VRVLDRLENLIPFTIVGKVQYTFPFPTFPMIFLFRDDPNCILAVIRKMGELGTYDTFPFKPVGEEAMLESGAHVVD